MPFDQTFAARKEPLPATLAQRFDEFEEVVATVEAELAEDHFSAGFGKFREALNLSRGFPRLEERVGALAVEQAKQLLPRSWHIARSLLLEAGEAGSTQAMPQELWEGILKQEREASIRNALSAASLASSMGMTGQARQWLAALEEKYAGDPRIESRLNAAEALDVGTPTGDALERVAKEAKTPESAQLVARALWARAREFQKSGFHEEALEQWKALRDIDPLYPGLENEIAGGSLVQSLPAVNSPAERGRPGVSSDRLKTSAPLLFASAALLAAGVIIWTHATGGNKRAREAKHPEVASSEPNTYKSAPRTVPPVIATGPYEVSPPAHRTVVVVDVQKPLPSLVAGANPAEQIVETPRIERRLELPQPPTVNRTGEIAPPAAPLIQEDLTRSALAQSAADMENRATAEKDAWSAVDTRDEHSVQGYLGRFPDGANRALAERAFIDIRAAESAKRQSDEVLAVIRRDAAAWSARDVDSILTLQRYLDRRSVKAQLSPLRSLVMNILPIAEPSIEGEQATVRCRRQVSQTFEDGIEKQGPEQTITFALTRRAGSWTIDGIH